jgi:hypothetical protein
MEIYFIPYLTPENRDVLYTKEYLFYIHYDQIIYFNY